MSLIRAGIFGYILIVFSASVLAGPDSPRINKGSSNIEQAQKERPVCIVTPISEPPSSPPAEDQVTTDNPDYPSYLVPLIVDDTLVDEEDVVLPSYLDHHPKVPAARWMHVEEPSDIQVPPTQSPVHEPAAMASELSMPPSLVSFVTAPPQTTSTLSMGASLIDWVTDPLNRARTGEGAAQKNRQDITVPEMSQTAEGWAGSEIDVLMKEKPIAGKRQTVFQELWGNPEHPVLAGSSADRYKALKGLEKQLQKGETLYIGSHSVVLKRHGRATKFYRKGHIRSFQKERDFYQNVLPQCPELKPYTCLNYSILREGDSPVISVEALQETASQELWRMLKENKPIEKRLRRALHWEWYFSEISQMQLSKNHLLGDRHGDNIGFRRLRIPIAQLKSSAPLKGMSGHQNVSSDMVTVSLPHPAMLDMDPYWRADDSRQMVLALPIWVPVLVELLTIAIRPELLDGDDEKNKLVRESNIARHNLLQNLAMPVPEGGRLYSGEEQSGKHNLIAQWLDDLLAGDVGRSDLGQELRTWLTTLFDGLSDWDDNVKSVASLIEQSKEETARVQKWLLEWKEKGMFPLLKGYQSLDEIQLAEREPSATVDDQGDELHVDSELSTYVEPLRELLKKNSDVVLECGREGCTRTFVKPEPFFAHHTAHSKGRLKKCVQCAGYFFKIDIHNAMHRGDKRYSCDKCGIKFIARSNLVEHSNVHTKSKPHICKVCGRAFSQLRHLKKHHVVHTERRIYICEICFNSFHSEYELAKHTRKHMSQAQGYSCEICGKIMATKRSLDNHTNTHMHDKPFKCNICGKAFACEANRVRHGRVHDKVRNYKCNYCPKTFLYNSNLKMHIRMHTGNVPNYQCNTCSKVFTSKHNLVYHENSHKGLKPHRCSYCPKAFTAKLTLDAHVCKHTGDRPYKCQNCDKSFVRRKGLKEHIRTHAKQPSFGCSVCGKGFARSDNFRRHFRKHTIKHYSCRICNKKFKQEINLIKHSSACESGGERIQTYQPPLHQRICIESGKLK